MSFERKIVIGLGRVAIVIAGNDDGAICSQSNGLELVCHRGKFRIEGQIGEIAGHDDEIRFFSGEVIEEFLEKLAAMGASAIDNKVGEPDGAFVQKPPRGDTALDR